MCIYVFVSMSKQTAFMVCMRLCVCVRVCVCKSEHMNRRCAVCMHLSARVCVCVCVCVCVRVCVCVCVWCVCARLYVCVCVLYGVFKSLWIKSEELLSVCYS